MTQMYSRFDYIDAARATAAQFAALVSSVTDPEARLSATPGWTVADCVGHVSTAPARYLALARGVGDWSFHAADVPDFNAKQIANLTSRDIPILVATLLDDLDELLDAVAHFGAQVPKMHFDGDRMIRADAALGILIGEFVVHGHDIARTVRAPWPVDSEVAAMIARGRHQILPSWVNASACAGHFATYDIHLRGSDESFIYEFTAGNLEINPPDPRPTDVHISVEPTTALLAGYGRCSPMWAGVTGRAFAWGGKPWLAPALAKRFLPA